MPRTLMPRTLRTLAATAIVVLAGATLAAPAQAGDDATMTGAPAVGDCFDLTLKQVEGYDLTEEAVDCGSDHTVVVSGVGKLPSSVDWTDEKAVSRAVGKQCPPTWWKLFGGDNDLLLWYRSQYTAWWLAPSEADRDAGARWFGCLVSVEDDRGLVDLPTRLPKLRKHMSDTIARCVTSKYAYTTCADSHAWRSSYAFYVRGKATKKNAVRAANRVCPHHVTSRTWLYSSWDITGKRFIVGCYSKDRH